VYCSQDHFEWIWCLVFTLFFYSGFAVLAPRASHSLSTATKSNQKRPPRQLRPLKKQGYPLRQHHYHAAPELAHVEKHERSDSWRRKPMIMALPQWLAKVGNRSKSKTVSILSTLIFSSCLFVFSFFLLTLLRISQAIGV
jgi:hypothetical protein